MNTTTKNQINRKKSVFNVFSPVGAPRGHERKQRVFSLLELLLSQMGGDTDAR